VIKDLVPDMTNFYKQYKSIRPWLVAPTKLNEGEYVQTIQVPILYTHIYML
jgi:succinate dehydrogenase/fumarate reductase-like Fe-S protein